MFLQFRTCIGTLGVNLTAGETDMLLAKYQAKDGTGLVNYRDLVNNLDTVFAEDTDTNAVIQNARTSAVSYKNWPIGTLTMDQLTWSKIQIGAR